MATENFGSSPSLKQLVYENLHSRIVNGELKPGERLQEAELAKEMNISRAPIREALNMLERDGLATIMPRKGTIVTVFTAEDVQNIWQMREIMEPVAAQCSAAGIPAEELDRIMSGGEGLGNLTKKVIRGCSSMDELAEALKSKRYTRTRVQRFAAQILLGIRREDVDQAKDYVRVLAFNEKGSRYLKQVKKAGICSLPIITNINKELKNIPEIRETIEKDILASDIFNP